MAPTRLWRVQSLPSQALAWSQSRYRQARMRLPGDLDRRSIASEDTVRDLARGTRVLTPHSARGLALLEKAGLIDHENRVVIRQMLDDIIADDIAQSISIPVPATQDRLLPPWTRIASCLRPHPTGLALLIAKQTFQKQACIRRNTLLPEQRTYPLLDLPKRRRP